MNLEILLFTFLLQWVATNAEDTNENEYNKNLIRNFLQHYAMHYPKIYDYDTKTKLYPPSHDSSEENSEFYSGNDSSPQSDGSPHVHYHHHIYGERHHTPQNENDGKAKEYNSPTLEENEFYSGNDGSPQSDGSPHVHYHHHIYGERHHTPQMKKDEDMNEKNLPNSRRKKMMNSRFLLFTLLLHSATANAKDTQVTKAYQNLIRKLTDKYDLIYPLPSSKARNQPPLYPYIAMNGDVEKSYLQNYDKSNDGKLSAGDGDSTGVHGNGQLYSLSTRSPRKSKSTRSSRNGGPPPVHYHHHHPRGKHHHIPNRNYERKSVIWIRNKYISILDLVGRLNDAIEERIPL
ncbi:hypothetical protein HNY73_022727 [Argiope bruennichi]|uniref:Uncharacterized protein n=1 Tax=Argiope bruennichi TaxID=94029 RepID=A0A8T0E2K4_ARGBR|nr:hypothetical protein HNY73_022727 [Argiope bruennichi]